jgi:hypothetical protein
MSRCVIRIVTTEAARTAPDASCYVLSSEQEQVSIGTTASSAHPEVAGSPGSSATVQLNSTTPRTAMLQERGQWWRRLLVPWSRTSATGFPVRTATTARQPCGRGTRAEGEHRHDHRPAPRPGQQPEGSHLPQPDTSRLTTIQPSYRPLTDKSDGSPYRGKREIAATDQTLMPAAGFLSCKRQLGRGMA